MADQFTVYFATNRNISGTDQEPSFGEFFHPLGPHYIRYGKATLDAAGGEGPGDDLLETDASLVLGREYEITSLELAPETIPTRMQKTENPGIEIEFGSDRIFNELRTSMKRDAQDVIVLIHGYSCTFNDAIRNGAALQDRYLANGKRCNVFVFSWPSDGETTPFLAYHSDRADAAASGVAISRAFLRLRDYLINLPRAQYCDQRIHLVAHSMGNYALRHAVQSIRSELGDQALPRVFENAFLMAADEDVDAFDHDHKLRLLPQLAKGVHVYFSPDDRALTISDFTKRNPDRLGTNGPRLNGNIPRNISLIDCRDVDRTALADGQHQYYRKRREVIEDIRQVLSGMQPSKIDGREWIHDDRSFRIKSQAEKKPAGPARARPGSRRA